MLIDQVTGYVRVRARFRAVLDILNKGPVVSKSGQATDKLYRMLPLDVIKSRSGKQLGNKGFSLTLKTMEENNWIIRDMSGKRTNSIALAYPPADWSPTLPGLELAASQSLERHPSTGELSLVSSELVTPIQARVEQLEEEAREGDIRPGRLAARLEKLETGIPALVEQGVTDSLNGWIKQLAVHMGMVSTDLSNDEEISELRKQLISARAIIDGLSDDLRAERAQGHASREELNQELRKQWGSTGSSPVQASQVHEAWRSLAHHAIKNGWMIYRTGGGHLMWKSPTGFRYYSSSSSSAYRSVRNARSDMEKEGLPNA